MDKQKESIEYGLLTVGIFLFNKVELLDFAGPYEVFSVTAELNQYRMFQVFTLSEDGRPIQTINGLKVMVDYSFDNHPPIDLLVIPGGVGTRNEVNNEAVIRWIQKAHRNGQLTMSVCSGSVLLGKAGLLEGLEAVTHHEVFHLLEKASPRTRINRDERWIDNDRVMTSAGISAGIDLSLHVVEKLYGPDIKKKTVTYMEYGDWKDKGNQ